MRSVRVEWEGPFCLDYVVDELNRKDDYGIYQIYGTHIILEPGGEADHLLYIGMTKPGSTFSERFKSHKASWIWYNLKHGGEISIHIAKLAPRSEEEIKLVEALEIYWHSPPYNGQHITSIDEYWYPRIKIINKGSRRKLLERIARRGIDLKYLITHLIGYSFLKGELNDFQTSNTYCIPVSFPICGVRLERFCG